MSDLPNIKIEKLEKLEPFIRLCNDFYIGTIKVKNKTYVPIWDKEPEKSYQARLAQTAFANMFAPIADGLAGLIIKKEPKVTGYDALDLDNIDLFNNSLQSFMKTTTKQSIVSGVSFVGALTSTELNRSYLKRFPYEHLYSYLIEDDVLKQIVFKEVVEVKDGTFGVEKQERFVVFTQGGGTVWYADDNSETIKEQDTWENDLKDIPIVAIVTGKVLTPFEVVPKMLDVAELNKVHLNLETNLANVLGVVGNPVPMFFGKTAEGNVTIGVKEALVFADKNTQGAEYLEIEGKGVSKLQEKITAVENQIDKLTFNLLVNEDSNTVIDAQAKQAKNTSFLSDVANEVEEKFETALNYMLQLENKEIPADANIEMQKDFDAVLVDLEVAFKALQSGDMSRETFYEVLETGKLPKNFKAEEENARIEKEV